MLHWFFHIAMKNGSFIYHSSFTIDLYTFIKIHISHAYLKLNYQRVIVCWTHFLRWYVLAESGIKKLGWHPHQRWWHPSRNCHLIHIPLGRYKYIYICIYNSWLVVEPYPSEKYEFVSWEYYSQYYRTIKHVPNHQPDSMCISHIMYICI